MGLCLLLEVWIINMDRNLLIQLQKSTTDAIKITSKRAIPKNAEATDDLVGNKIGDKITSVSKENYNNKNNDDDDDDDDDDDVELTTHKKRYIWPKERKQIIEELRLVPNSNA